MGNRIDNRIVLGSLRYKSSPNVDMVYPTPLIQNFKPMIEYDRTIEIGLDQLFYDERQSSEIFRPSTKFTVLFKNSYAGFTNYPPFENNLYYVNARESAIDSCPENPSVAWSGFPQYNEFDFIRNDYNVPGYTQQPDEHIIFTPQSSSTYNWNFFLSYPYSNDTNKKLYGISKNNIPVTWTCSNGIPFVIETGTDNGINIISFRCLVKHNLSVGESVELSFDYDGETIFDVDSLGNGIFGTDEYIFNIVNIGYTGSTFDTNVKGTAKRIILKESSGDTMSKYYVRKHKIMTNVSDSVLVKAGFEENIFGVNKKFESAALTPNKTSRVSILEGSQSYTLSFNKDIDLYGLLDNQKRPISELFFSVIWKGYFGWTKGLKQGWEFNLPLSPVTNRPNIWWDTTSSPSSASLTTIQTLSYTKSNWSNPFYYNKPLQDGDIIDGDFCEWNDYEQKERVISKLYHKLTFNPQQFNTGDITPTNPFGYYYQPHHSITIRSFSPYIEEGGVNEVDIPNWAHYSTTNNNFIWRDVYPYGYIDNDFVGVDYPFLNGKHYPNNNIIFRIIPEGTNYNQETIVAEPTIDDCE